MLYTFCFGFRIIGLFLRCFDRSVILCISSVSIAWFVWLIDIDISCHLVFVGMAACFEITCSDQRVVHYWFSLFMLRPLYPCSLLFCKHLLWYWWQLFFCSLDMICHARQSWSFLYFKLSSSLVLFIVSHDRTDYLSSDSSFELLVSVDHSCSCVWPLMLY